MSVLSASYGQSINPLAALGCLSAISNLGYLYSPLPPFIYLCCCGTFCHIGSAPPAHVTDADPTTLSHNVQCATLSPIVYVNVLTLCSCNLAPARSAQISQMVLPAGKETSDPNMLRPAPFFSVWTTSRALLQKFGPYLHVALTTLLMSSLLSYCSP